MPEPRLPCPVCLGVKMVKHRPSGNESITLDLCPRCGGMWFEKGEVQAIRAGSKISDFGTQFEAARTRCLACGAVVDRQAEACPVCGDTIQLDCPDCQAVMEAVSYGELTLDLCTRCRGVWFDRHELAGLWSAALGATALARSRSGSYVLDPGSMLLDALHSAELLVYTADIGTAVVDGVAQAGSGSVEILAVLPEAASVVAEAAAATFEFLLEAVAAILSGL